jgi:thiol-disulfide isomerase/thioredoxin
MTVASLRGRPTLLWFVTTWCTSCAAGTKVMAQEIGRIAASGARVVELENNGDLGQAGPSMGQFARSLAGSAVENPAWILGEASSSLTRTYNPAGYLDIYYVIDTAGDVTYVSSAPASTMGQLLAALGVR